MATQAQIDANRANAQKSTGPKTPEGKAKSRRNGLKHGLTAEACMLADEDAQKTCSTSSKSSAKNTTPKTPTKNS